VNYQISAALGKIFGIAPSVAFEERRRGEGLERRQLEIDY
jgi:hypothetical protein